MKAAVLPPDETLVARVSKRTFHVGASIAVVVGLGALSDCSMLAAVPGLVPRPIGPPARIVPEPARCGRVGDPPSKPTDPQAPIPKNPIVGAADYHNHQFANLGFGGRMLWGESFDPHGIAEALSPCGPKGLCVDETEAGVCSVACALAPDPASCRASCERSRCTSPTPHGHMGLTDPVGAALGQGLGHFVEGYPDFQGWPYFSTYTHQQEYHRWLRRAFDGGLKLIVVHAVSSQVLCELLGHVHACDDTTNADLQLEEAEKLECFIDQENNCQYDGDGWYRIARSPGDARKIIASGAMAVVLGLEIDAPFNCTENGSCTPESVRNQVKKYYERGVRHVFPVHVLDNAFGGAAAYSDLFNFGNVVVNHRLLDVKDCSPTYAFRFDQATTEATDLMNTIATRFGVDYPGYPKAGAHCNTRPLSSLGGNALKAMMEAGMIIDVDHMSAATREGVLSLSEALHYPGIVSGHSGFTTLYRGQKKHEGQLTDEEVARLLRLGGLLAPILHQGSRDELVSYQQRTSSKAGTRATTIAHDCGNSAKSFAQAYLYAVDQVTRVEQTKPPEDRLVAVGFGSDINGLAGLPAPRFGPYACGGDGVTQTGRVPYPVKPLNGSVEVMDRHQEGHRVFDINEDGFAHMGMFADFVAELQAIGLTADDLAPLYNSAEAYIRLWERAESWPGHAGQTPVVEPESVRCPKLLQDQ